MPAVGWTVGRLDGVSFQQSNRPTFLERPPCENQERPGLVALRARDRAELQIRQAVDVAALDGERARGAEARAAADHRSVAGGRPVGVGARRRAGTAAQLKRELRT